MHRAQSYEHDGTANENILEAHAPQPVIFSLCVSCKICRAVSQIFYKRSHQSQMLT